MATDGARGGNISSEAVFDMLRLVTRAERPLGIADLHRLTNEPTSSAHRAVSTLEQTGYAARYQGTARFIPGRMCSHLVRALVARFALQKTARPYLARLVELFGGAGTLNVRLGWYSVRLLSLDGRIEIVETRRIGQPRHLHQDLGPLAILCFMEEEERRRYAAFARQELNLAPDGLDVEKLVREALRPGYAQRLDIVRKDRAWIGLPVFGPDAKVIASMSLIAPVDPVTGALDARLATEATATVASLRRELAADPSKCAAPFAGYSPDDIRLKVDSFV